MILVVFKPVNCFIVLGPRLLNSVDDQAYASFDVVSMERTLLTPC